MEHQVRKLTLVDGSYEQNFDSTDLQIVFQRNSAPRIEFHKDPPTFFTNRNPFTKGRIPQVKTFTDIKVMIFGRNSALVINFYKDSAFAIRNPLVEDKIQPENSSTDMKIIVLLRIIVSHIQDKITKTVKKKN